MTDEQIEQIASEHTDTCEYPSRFFLRSNTFARAIESAATAPVLERIAEMEAKLAQAVKFLRQGKAQFAPNTTNSDVDMFLASMLSAAPAAPEQLEPLSTAWEEGYKAGIDDERTSDANIGVAGFGAKVNPNRQNPYGSTKPEHPDNLAVDAFSVAMKEKLAAARSKGRGGWQECAPGVLSGMLREHVEKGDPIDVANFCMFLWSLGQGIAKAPNAQQAEAHESKLA